MHRRLPLAPLTDLALLLGRDAEADAGNSRTAGSYAAILGLGLGALAMRRRRAARR